MKEDFPVAAHALGLTIQPWEIRAADGFEKVFAALSKQRPDGLYVPGGGQVITANRKRIACFALKSRLPSMYNNRESVDAGGLMSLRGGPRRGIQACRILRGQNPEGSQAKPADLPVEQPMKFELVINLKTAKQIGLTIPPNVLARADKVIK